MKEEMKKFMEHSFIKRLKDLPKDIQTEISSNVKHYIPTTVAFKFCPAQRKRRVLSGQDVDPLQGEQVRYFSRHQEVLKYFKT